MMQISNSQNTQPSPENRELPEGLSRPWFAIVVLMNMVILTGLFHPIIDGLLT
jgi:hypothetical protein